jgi:hypothetical protein
VSQRIQTEAKEEEDSDIPPEADINKRDACRLTRALKKVAYNLRGPREEKAKKPERKVYRAFITLEDQVGIHHLSHWVGKKEELQTTLQHPHQFRKTLIRVYRLKNLRWSLLRKGHGGNLVPMPEVMQILEEDAEYVVRMEEQKRRHASAPGSSKRNHFEKANQKRGRKDFNWSPNPAGGSQRPVPKSHEESRSEDGHHVEGNPDRFTWTSGSEPHIEPPRPPDWKPLVLTPQLIQLSEEGERKLADQRMKEWRKGSGGVH